MQVVKFRSSYAEPYPLQVEGESYHRDNIEDVSGYTGEEEGVNADDFTAQLILEDDNSHDSNAVRVDIDGKAVGHLSRTAAKQYRQKLKDLGYADVIGECSASVKGGFIKKDGSQADFGVRLDIIIDELEKQPVPSIKPIAPHKVVPAPAVATPKMQPLKSDESIFVRVIKWVIKKPSNILSTVLIVIFLIVACQILAFIFIR